MDDKSTWREAVICLGPLLAQTGHYQISMNARSRCMADTQIQSHQRRRYSRRHGLTHNLARVQVQHCSQMQPTAPCADVGDIADPDHSGHDLRCFGFNNLSGGLFLLDHHTTFVGFVWPIRWISRGRQCLRRALDRQRILASCMCWGLRSSVRHDEY